jgi:hypothetical protein
MNGKSKIASLAAAAAMTGLIGGASMTMVGCQKDSGSNANKVSPAHACKGMNACKGQGGCKSGDNGCAGKNSCKGKGGCKVS